MEESFKQDNIAGKEEKYLHFLEQYSHLIEGEKNIISVLANTTAALKEAFGFFWIGFYLIEEGELHLGPFQGSVACYRIKKRKRCVRNSMGRSQDAGGGRRGSFSWTHCMQFAFTIGNSGTDDKWRECCRSFGHRQ